MKGNQYPPLPPTVPGLGVFGDIVPPGRGLIGPPFIFILLLRLDDATVA